MKKLNLISLLLAVMVLGLAACTGKNSSENSEAAPDSVAMKKAVVCYFSATGTTAEQARRIADLTGADLHEIVPSARYTAADLDWRDTLSRCYVEMHNRRMRPEIAGTLDSLDAYEVVFIGYPNWWNTAPTIINSFIESRNFNGKTIVPFMTSGGDDIVNSEKDLKEAYPTLTFAPGLLMNAVSDEEILRWAGAVLNQAR